MTITIEMPDEDIRHSFTSFNKAVKFCETEFGYGKEIEVDAWKEIKKTKDMTILKDFLWIDGLWVELTNE